MKRTINIYMIFCMHRKSREPFDITPNYGKDRKKICWSNIEKTQLWMWSGESVLAKDVVWGDLLLYQYNNNIVKKNDINHIIIKTLDIGDAVVDMHPDKWVTILKNIP